MLPALFLLAAWIPEGPRPAFDLIEDEIRCRPQGPGHWVRSDQEYENLHLFFEYKLDRWSEAAVVLRAPRWGRPMQSGVPVTLAHDFHRRVTPYVTGALTGVRPPDAWPGESYGVWHRVAIQLEDDQLIVRIDDRLVLTTRVPPERDRRGYVLFPDLNHPYSIRNIRIEDRGRPTRFVDLMRTPWEARDGNTARWTVSPEQIRGESGDGILYGGPTFRNFELTLAVRSLGYVNGGIFLRGAPTGDRGFEVQVYAPPDAVYPTGSIYNLARSEIDWDTNGQWIWLRIRVDNRRCTVHLNGRLVAQTDALPESPGQGRIGIQMHSTGQAIEVRDARVRPL